MAKLKGPLQMTGQLGNLSIYTRRDSDAIIVRTKGGATKEQIKNDPAFENTRRGNREWGGATKLGGAIRNSVIALARLADYNVSGTLNAIALKMVKGDTLHEWGERSASLSQHRSLVAGFNFNRKHLFDSVVRVTPTWSIDRDTQQAQVTIPELVPALHLENFTKLPYFRFVVALGVVSDMDYDKGYEKHIPVVEAGHGCGTTVCSEWFTEKGTLPEQVIGVIPYEKQLVLNDRTSLVLGIGIEFGTVGDNGLPVAVKYAGCAKVLGVR